MRVCVFKFYVTMIIRFVVSIISYRKYHVDDYHSYSHY